MKKTFAVSKIENGRVVEVRELSKYPIPDIRKDLKLKTFPVAGEDGEVEKAELIGICEWIKTTDEWKKIDYRQPGSIFYHVAPLAFAELIHKYAHAQKYGYSLQQARKIFEAGKDWGIAYASKDRGVTYSGLFIPTGLQHDEKFNEYIKSLHPTPTIGQLVECEIDEASGTVKIIKL